MQELRQIYKNRTVKKSKLCGEKDCFTLFFKVKIFISDLYDYYCFDRYILLLFFLNKEFGFTEVNSYLNWGPVSKLVMTKGVYTHIHYIHCKSIYIYSFMYETKL